MKLLSGGSFDKTAKFNSSVMTPHLLSRAEAIEIFWAGCQVIQSRRGVAFLDPFAFQGKVGHHRTRAIDMWLLFSGMAVNRMLPKNGKVPPKRAEKLELVFGDAKWRDKFYSQSGPKSRPMSPQWVRSLRDQCIEEKVAFHFKQWGHWTPVELLTVEQKKTLVFDEYEMAAAGKKHAGRSLDGRTWDELPKSA